MKSSASELIQGDIYADARGSLRFCNDFDMGAVKRFYTISNSAECPDRGWIGHKKEVKWFFPLRGKTTIVLEPMNCSRAETPRRREVLALEADKPCVLKVEPGNWFCIKQDGNSEVMVFSDCRVGEFKDDDFRRPYE